MTMSMDQASIPVFAQTLSALSSVLDKAGAYASAKKIDPDVLLAARLSADMFALSRQVQLACEFAKGAAARLAGQEAPAWDDGEATFAALRQRIGRTLDYVKSFKAGQIDGSQQRAISIKIAGAPVAFKGQAYLLQFVLPNFFFHATVGYAILRHNGLDIGKRDFLGEVPGLTLPHAPMTRGETP
jgi:uncharacterized protein